MKKKTIIIGAILGVVILGLVGYNLYETHKENEKKEVFLEWFHDVELEEIRLTLVVDTRNAEKYEDHLEFELTEEQKVRICKIMRSVKAEEIVFAKKAPHYMNCLDVNVFTTQSNGQWCFRFDDGETVYIYGMPDKVNDIIGYPDWEIKNAELVKFCEEIYDK